jgi:hypothetical protein
VASRRTNKHKTTLDLARDVSKKKFGKYNKDFINLIRKVFADYLEQVTDNILDGKLYKIPMRLGFIRIVKSKTSPVDWRNTTKLGTVTYFKNFHTDGYTYRWAWFKKNSYAIFTNKTRYCFKPYRPLKEKLKTILLTEHRDYPLWSSYR